MGESIFASGIMFKLPRDNAPDFVKGSLSIKMDDFNAWAKDHEEKGWINLDLKVGKSGKPYVELNLWKPEKSNVPF
jgi:hypothetical protein